MRYSYQFHEFAQADYETSLSWYLERSEKAASGFVSAVDEGLARICAHPTRYRNPYKHYFEVALKKYPFVIIYSIEEENSTIIIWKLFHYRRNPTKKYSGLKR